MSGDKSTASELNNTLLFIVSLLHSNHLTNWFIGYGTLLGIVRNNSCIENDDDIDVLIDKKNYDVLKDILVKNGFTIEYGHGINTSRDILKTKTTDKYCTIDFYMCEVDNQGNFHDKWEKTIWSNCYDVNGQFLQTIWNEQILYLPCNYEQKLINRYGNDWKTPKKSKGVFPRKSIL